MKKFTQTLTLTFSLLLLFQLSTVSIEAEEVVEVYLNNDLVEFNNFYGFPFIDEKDRTQVPFRLTLETFGAVVKWDGVNNIAKATKGNITVEVPIGEKYIYKNGEMIITDTEAVIINDRTYLPIRTVMEAFDCEVIWISNGKKVFIDYETKSQISSVPVAYDMRENNLVSSVKDQGDIGACWAFAALGAIESDLLPNERYDFSEDHLSLTHGYNLLQDDGGDFKVALSYFASWSGPVLEADDPYGDFVANEKAVTKKHIQEAIFIPSKNYTQIKLSILLYGGVQSLIYMEPNIESSTSGTYNIETSAFCYKGQMAYNHDVVIVGWDDNYPKENFTVQPSANGAFICKNSYGESFGDGGYLYISYEDVHIGTKNIVYSKVEKLNNYDNIYQTDMLGWIGRIGYGNSTAYFANVYEPENEEELVATSFYATDNNTSYEIYLVEDFTSKKDLNSRTLITRGTIEFAGYYTIEFENPLSIGEQFAVVVKITTPNSRLPVAVEYYRDVPWLDEVDISDGKGYMSPDGVTWERTEDLVESNVCLKAFTNNIN
jgi:C1A family cysteine protease